MQRISRKNTIYMGMAFLFVTLAITPISLKAIGISPNLLAGVDAWRQISNVFGDGHQIVNSTEILALNNLNSGGAGREDEAQPVRIAKMQLPSAETFAPQARSIDSQNGFEESPSNQQKRCPKSASRPARAIRQDEMISFASAENEATAQKVEAAAKPAFRFKREDWAKIGKQLAQYSVEIDEAIKIAPIRDMRVMVKLKSLNLSFPRALINCDSRKALTPEQTKEIRLRASRMAVEPVSPSAPENCEL